MNWQGLRIAYAPYSNGMKGPGDRRRFVFFARARGIKFEPADTNVVYDIVYLTLGCDLSSWVLYKKRNPSVKLIFEMVDSYLLENANFISAFRGIVKYVLRKESNLSLNYKSLLREIVLISDAIVCSTDAQRCDMLKFNPNIHVSLDYFSDDIFTHKLKHERGSVIRLVWEGLPYTVDNLLMLNDVFAKISVDVEIYIITDPTVSYFGLFSLKTERLLRGFRGRYHLVPWDRKSVSAIISSCDLAIIPINPSNTLAWNKPENKLLLFWEIGIPTLTSNTSAYKSSMDVAGIDYYCSSVGEWIQKIERFATTSTEGIKTIVDAGHEYIQTYHSRDRILGRWDSIFDSLNTDAQGARQN